MASTAVTPTDPPRRRFLRPVTGVVAAVLVGLAAFTTVEFVRTPASASVSNDRQSALNAANLVAVNFTTLDYRQLTQDFQRLAALATPSFRQAYLTQTNAAAEYIVRFKGRSTGTVVASAVQNADAANAEVIVAINDTIVNTKYPKGTIRYFRLDIKLARQHGKWLVNSVDPV